MKLKYLDSEHYRAGLRDGERRGLLRAARAMRRMRNIEMERNVRVGGTLLAVSAFAVATDWCRVKAKKLAEDE